MTDQSIHSSLPPSLLSPPPLSSFFPPPYWRCRAVLTISWYRKKPSSFSPLLTFLPSFITSFLLILSDHQSYFFSLFHLLKGGGGQLINFDYHTSLWIVVPFRIQSGLLSFLTKQLSLLLLCVRTICFPFYLNTYIILLYYYTTTTTTTVIYNQKRKKKQKKIQNTF